MRCGPSWAQRGGQAGRHLLQVGLGVVGTQSVIFSRKGHASLVLLSGDMDIVG